MTGNLDVEDVGERLHPFGALALLAAVEQLLAGARRFVLRQAGGQQLLGEASNSSSLRRSGR